MIQLVVYLTVLASMLAILQGHLLQSSAAWKSIHGMIVDEYDSRYCGEWSAAKRNLEAGYQWVIHELESYEKAPLDEDEVRAIYDRFFNINVSIRSALEKCDVSKMDRVHLYRQSEGRTMLTYPNWYFKLSIVRNNRGKKSC